jgi:hypothetical protein
MKLRYRKLLYILSAQTKQFIKAAAAQQAALYFLLSQNSSFMKLRYRKLLYFPLNIK